MKPTVLAPWTRQAEMPVAKIEAISMITPKMKIPDGDCHHCHHCHHHHHHYHIITSSSCHHIIIIMMWTWWDGLPVNVLPPAGSTLVQQLLHRPNQRLPIYQYIGILGVRINIKPSSPISTTSAKTFWDCHVYSTWQLIISKAAIAAKYIFSKSSSTSSSKIVNAWQ